MTSLVTRLVFATSTIFAATLMALPASAQTKDEVPAAAKEVAAPAADEGAAPAPAAAPEAAKPAEAPPCDCPPPCPVPPPPPLAQPVAAADAIEWKAQTKGGMMMTGGNTQSKNFTVGVNASRKEGSNKLALEGGLAYGTSNNSVATVDTASNTITEVRREKVVSANNWAAKGRYDRFVTPNNSAFLSGLAAADKIAGKSFFGGGQLGYSRQLLKDAMHTLVAELGYDFSYERYVAGNDPVTIHSARVFVGETLSLTKDTGVTGSVEALFNLNKENKAINAKDGSTGVGAFKDTRVNGKVQLTTNLWKSLGFGFGVGFKYDQNPAPRPIPANAGGAKWPAQYWSLAYAQHWDLVTEATLLYTFF